MIGAAVNRASNALRAPFRSIRSLFRPSSRRRSPKSDESGYVYLMVLFLALALVVGSTTAVQNVLTTGRREREENMIWRGNQYVRAIRLYYKKTGRYPQTLDDLEKGQPQLHFLRYAAYKDPMNKSDGAWRLIYINGSGAIIGSVKYASLQQMAFLDLGGAQATAAQQGAQVGVPAASLASQSAASSATSATGPNGATANQPGQPLGPNGQPAVNPLTLLKPTGPVTGPVLGGFVTGVGSTVDRTAQRIYKGGKKYKDWEFIWNPLEDQALATAQGLGGQVPAGIPGQPGQAIGVGPAGTNAAPNPGAAQGATPGSAPPGGNPGSNPGLGAPPPGVAFPGAPQNPVP